LKKEISTTADVFTMVFLLPEKYILFERFKQNNFLLVILAIRQGEKKRFEAMPIKWINQSRQTGRGPPDV